MEIQRGRSSREMAVSNNDSGDSDDTRARKMADVDDGLFVMWLIN